MSYLTKYATEKAATSQQAIRVTCDFLLTPVIARTRLSEAPKDVVRLVSEVQLAYPPLPPPLQKSLFWPPHANFTLHLSAHHPRSFLPGFWSTSVTTRIGQRVLQKTLFKEGKLT